MLGFLGLGFLGFFNLTQTNKSPRVWVFSALMAQVRRTQKNSKKYKICPSLLQAWTRITCIILSLSNQILVLHWRNMQVAIRPAYGSCLQKMLIPNVKHAVLVIPVTSLLSSTRSLSEWKITLSNVPCSLNLWWKWMKTLVHSGSMKHYQTRNWSPDNLLHQYSLCSRHQWNSFVFLVLSNLNWSRSKTALLCISTSRVPHSNE